LERLYRASLLVYTGSIEETKQRYRVMVSYMLPVLLGHWTVKFDIVIDSWVFPGQPWTCNPSSSGRGGGKLVQRSTESFLCTVQRTTTAKESFKHCDVTCRRVFWRSRARSFCPRLWPIEGALCAASWYYDCTRL